MRRYIARRLLLAIPVLIGVTFGTFVLIRVVPGDIVDLKCGNQCTEEDRAELRKALDLDRPIVVQYLTWLGDAVRGDFGRSLQTSQPVSETLTSRVPVTVELAALAMLFAVALALPVAIIAALFQDRPPDYALRFLSILGLGVPNFWIASMVVTLPAIWWAWVPPTGHTPFFSDPVDNLRKLFIPALILSLSLSALIMRLLRSSLLEVLRQDYVRTARSKGLNGRQVIIRHAMRNALVPVVTVIGIQFGFLLGGTVIIEQIFVIPGIGTSTLSAILQRDYPQLQANVLVLAAMFVAANLAVDVMYALIDPRIKYT